MEDWMENARMIVDSARAIVPADGDLNRVRAARGKGIDRAMVAKAGELGLFLMRVPEEAGGLGLGMREACELMQVLGGGLTPEPIGSTIMAAALLGEAFPEEAATGAKVMVTAWQDDAASLRFEGGAADGRLHGVKIAVPDDADFFAVLTGAGVAVVPRDAPGVTITAADTLDGGRIATLRLDKVAAELIPCPQAATVIQDAVLMHSAYLLGLSDRAFAITLDYLKVREQFGRPIGSFQALQHRATEIKIRIELLRAAVMATAARFDTGADIASRARDADRCKLRAAETVMLVAREAVQMHGAMGITDEADIGLFVRRAMTDANLFGAPIAVRARLARTLEDAA
ncbi:acyl-CoA dehydrogenase family protein [Martelella mediterranea]|uniref:acyl-CoA dehydrogenase family protein n=1 Tax=Martelella mediterranea TaxID=293089 RepID=UPI001E2A8B5A|nr:acyl-CoA dehydrogenase family protein [Martelella mediterranea]